jgi:hypothetical protein
MKTVKAWAIVAPGGSPCRVYTFNRSTAIETFSDEMDEPWRILRKDKFRCIRVLITPMEDRK